MQTSTFGKNRLGEEITRYEISSGKLSAYILDEGATLQSLIFDGTDVVLGYDNIAHYERNEGYLGATVGRYANRIARGQFTLNGKHFQLDCNEKGKTHLHGGQKSVCFKKWSVTSHREDEITLSVTDQGDGYPGTVTLSVRFSVKDDTLGIAYSAVSDEDTPINLTNHAYFNLGGVGSGDILDTVLTLSASEITPVDADLIPIGELWSVAGTPFDFRAPTAIGAHIADHERQLMLGGGYDHNFCIDGTGLRPFCTAFSPKSGITLTGFTDQPGVQLYTGNCLSTDAGKAAAGKEKGYGKFEGFCLETQHYPDSPNHSSFPSTVLKAGETFQSTTLYSFKRSGK